MRTTYLLQEKQLDGSTCLVETTAENWHAIVRACAKLPTDQRRYFIRDVIPDDKGVDCMFIETTKETWQEWDREQRRIRDNLQHRKQYEHIPVESMLTMQDDILANAGLESEDIADSAVSCLTCAQLRQSVAEWHKWAPMLMDYYMDGKKTSCTAEVARRCGVSEQVARKYKRQFEKFVGTFYS